MRGTKGKVYSEWYPKGATKIIFTIVLFISPAYDMTLS